MLDEKTPAPRHVGQVALIGAGPGDPELLTLKAAHLLGEADVVVHDRLVSQPVLDMVGSGATLIDVGKAPRRHPVPQSRINDLLAAHALGGASVVRLKGGDPYIFGRGSEEALALRKRQIPVIVVPGITAAQGVAAVTGVPLTHRGLASSVRYVTGHCRADLPLDLDWSGLADRDTTLVIYMGSANIAEIADRLITAGMPASLSVLVVVNGTRPDQQQLVSRLDRVADDIRQIAGRGPLLCIVGRVVSLCPGALSSHLAAAQLRLDGSVDA